MDNELTGTKERIFDTAIMLFAKEGYENVSMRDIANGATINVASIYNHFSSKDEILDTIYQYFRLHRLDNRKSVDRISRTIETGTAYDVVKILSDTAFEFEEKIAIRMVLVPKIVLMRIYRDQKANQFFLHEWFGDDITHLRKWLGYAVEIGRLDEGFDIESFSIFFWRQLVMMGIWAFADPNYEVKILDEEERLLRTFATLLPLKDPI